MNNLKKLACTLGFCLMLPAISHAATITFDFTGKLVVAYQGNILVNNGSPVTPIAARLIYNTSSGIGSSNLTVTMSSPFWGGAATFNGISMNRVGANTITGQIPVSWTGGGVFPSISNVPLQVEWDATGLFNAINHGLLAGDVIRGTNLYRGTDAPVDVFSATPYSDTLQDDQGYTSLQGPAPMAATSGSQGFAGTGIYAADVRGYFDIGSGNSMHVISVVPDVPIPAAAWLFGSGLLGLLGVARRKAS